jgi:fermentation-respiration switch protein FrsA (DUF1100 family)
MRGLGAKAVLLFPCLIGSGGCESMPNGKDTPRWALEKSLVYYPKCFPEGDWDKKPSHFEDVSFESSDGTRLHGWYVEAKHPRAVILYNHGNGGNITDRTDAVLRLHERHGATVFIYDYRGYGKSEGQPNESGILQDARSARRWLANRSGIDEQEIVLLGYSLGGGVAVDLAAKDGAKGLILENTFTSLPDVGRWYTRGLPLRWIMVSRLDSKSKIPHYHGPLLQTHGDADKVVPYKLGKRLFEQANEPKEFIAAPGGGHADLPTPEYVDALDRFLDRLAKPPDQP